MTQAALQSGIFPIPAQPQESILGTGSAGLLFPEKLIFPQKAAMLLHPFLIGLAAGHNGSVVVQFPLNSTITTRLLLSFSPCSLQTLLIAHGPCRPLPSLPIACNKF